MRTSGTQCSSVSMHVTTSYRPACVASSCDVLMNRNSVAVKRCGENRRLEMHCCRRRSRPETDPDTCQERAVAAAVVDQTLARVRRDELARSLNRAR